MLTIASCSYEYLAAKSVAALAPFPQQFQRFGVGDFEIVSGFERRYTHMMQ